MDKIQSGYIDNTYHNKIHAFDVTITVNFFLSTCDFINVVKLTPLELSYAYIGAACHDYEHPGVNNAFLVNSRAKLAIIYNDKSPLENHHISSTFFVLKEEKYNILENFSKDEYK